MSDQVYVVPNPPAPNRVLDFNPDKCTGCNRCMEVCPTDVMMPNPVNKQPPIVVYAEECWYCAACVEECPCEGAIAMLHPTSQRISVNWRRRETGEYFRLGMKNPPPPFSRPPSG